MHQETHERVRRPEAYFSVSHLLNGVHVMHDDGTMTRHTIVSRGRDLPDGRAKFQALGGGAKLTERAISDLRARFGESLRFREGEESDDARFYVELPEGACVGADAPEEEHIAAQACTDAFTQTALAPFLELDPTLIEDSVQRELEHDLKEAVPDITEDELHGMHSEHVGVVSPIRWSETTSTRTGGANTYCRIFHLFDITIPESLFLKMKKTDGLRVLSAEDLAQIADATRDGNVTATLKDGSVVVENVFPDSKSNT